MFAAFIYTECMSPGPFKRESGFKFKSVQQVSLDTDVASQASLEQRMNLASAAFLPYQAPTIDSFMKPDEFLALDKHWALQEVGPGTFMFSRLFTSGVSNGRPDNPFHQGFIYDFVDINSIVVSTGEMSGFKWPRPADFHSWADWCNPRGDSQLEAAALEDANPPMPSIDTTEWCARVEATFESDLDDSMQILSGFEMALKSGANLGIYAGDVDDFLNWVSLLSHLLPIKTAWTMQFSSGEAAKHFSKVPARTSIYKSEAPVTRVETADWARLVKLIIEAGVHPEIEEVIGFLSEALVFDHNSGSQALAALPLACSFLEQNSLDPSDMDEIGALAATLLFELSPPLAWTNESLAREAFDKLESKTSLIKYMPNGDLIYETLSRLGIQRF